VAVRRLDYFGFELETVAEELEGVVPAGLRQAFAETLTDALVADDTVHSNQPRISRALGEAAELYRRSGGQLSGLSEEAVRAQLRAAIEGVSTWEEFLGTRLPLDPVSAVPAAERERLAALPGSVRLLGDQVPLEYEIEQGQAVVRLRLREGQARRLRSEELPALDRPLRFREPRGAARPAASGALDPAAPEGVPAAAAPPPLIRGPSAEQSEPVAVVGLAQLRLIAVHQQVHAEPVQCRRDHPAQVGGLPLEIECRGRGLAEVADFLPGRPGTFPHPGLGQGNQAEPRHAPARTGFLEQHQPECVDGRRATQFDPLQAAALALDPELGGHTGQQVSLRTVVVEQEPLGAASPGGESVEAPAGKSALDEQRGRVVNDL
jgi:hypothetical protein